MGRDGDEEGNAEISKIPPSDDLTFDEQEDAEPPR